MIVIKGVFLSYFASNKNKYEDYQLNWVENYRKKKGSFVKNYDIN